MERDDCFPYQDHGAGDGAGARYERDAHRCNGDVVSLQAFLLLLRCRPGTGDDDFKHPQARSEEDNAPHDLKCIKGDTVKLKNVFTEECENEECYNPCHSPFPGDDLPLVFIKPLRQNKKYSGYTQWVHQCKERGKTEEDVFQITHDAGYIFSGWLMPRISSPLARTVLTAETKKRRAIVSSLSSVTTRCSL